jgi:hypothetical protein
MIDNFNPNHAMILPRNANPKPDGIFGKDRFSTSSRRGGLNRSAMKVASRWMIANIASDDALILRHRANPRRNFRDRHLCWTIAFDVPDDRHAGADARGCSRFRRRIRPRCGRFNDRVLRLHRPPHDFDHICRRVLILLGCLALEAIQHVHLLFRRQVQCAPDTYPLIGPVLGRCRACSWTLHQRYHVSRLADRSRSDFSRWRARARCSVPRLRHQSASASSNVLHSVRESAPALCRCVPSAEALSTGAVAADVIT